MAMAEPVAGEAGDEPVEALLTQFGALIGQLRIAIRRRAARLHPELQPLGYTLLALVRRHDALPQRRLLELLATDKSTVSRVLRQLDRLGLIERSPDPADGRASVIALSAEGEARWAAASGADRAELRARFADWDPEELRTLTRLLGRVNGMLEE